MIPAGSFPAEGIGESLAAKYRRFHRSIASIRAKCFRCNRERDDLIYSGCSLLSQGENVTQSLARDAFRAAGESGLRYLVVPEMTLHLWLSSQIKSKRVHI